MLFLTKKRRFAIILLLNYGFPNKSHCTSFYIVLEYKLIYFVHHFLKVLIISDLGILKSALYESLNTIIKYQKCKENGTENVNNP